MEDKCPLITYSIFDDLGNNITLTSKLIYLLDSRLLINTTNSSYIGYNKYWFVGSVGTYTSSNTSVWLNVLENCNITSLVYD